MIVPIKLQSTLGNNFFRTRPPYHEQNCLEIWEGYLAMFRQGSVVGVGCRRYLRVLGDA